MSLLSKADLLWKWNRLGLQLARLLSALKKESAVNGYSLGITIRKGLEGIAHGLVPVLTAALYAYFTDAPAITHALQNAGYSPLLIAALVPAINGATRMVTNWWKNRNRQPAVIRSIPAPTGYTQIAPERDDR